MTEDFLLDTNIAVFALRRRSGPLRARLIASTDGLAISSITEMELAYGVERSTDRTANLVATAEFLANLTVLPFDSDAARKAGEVRALLAQAGTPIGAYDSLIAGHALATRRTVVTNNVREFTRVPGLRIVDWTS